MSEDALQEACITSQKNKIILDALIREMKQTASDESQNVETLLAVSLLLCDMEETASSVFYIYIYINICKRSRGSYATF